MFFSVEEISLLTTPLCNCFFFIYAQPINFSSNPVTSLELQKRLKDLTTKIALEEAVHKRSTHVRALPRENLANAFLNYVNRWKED